MKTRSGYVFSPYAELTDQDQGPQRPPWRFRRNPSWGVIWGWSDGAPPALSHETDSTFCTEAKKPSPQGAAVIH